MREKVKPLFRQIFMHTLNERPEDPIKYMIKFLEVNRGYILFRSNSL